MKQFSGFIQKEFYHIFRDPRTMLILFAMPIVQILLFGYVVTNELKDIKIAIYDPAKDPVTLHITNKILSSGYFQLYSNLETLNDAETIFKTGKIKQIIVFEPHFAERLERNKKATIQLLADASDANTANLIVNYTSGIIKNYVAEKNKTTPLHFQIIPEVKMMFNESMKSAFMFVPGTMAMILVLISAMMTSISIVREKELGTMEVLLVSPLNAFQIVIGKVIPYIFLAFTNAVTIIILGRFIFEMPITGNIVLLLAESLLYISLALSIGIFISTISKTQQVAMFASMLALMLPTILLSGFIFPIENMPWILQLISNIVPSKWFIIILKNIMLKGVGITYILKPTLILFVMTIFFIVLSIKRFKIRLE